MSKAAIVGTLLAALETAPLDAYDYHHLGRKAHVFEGDRIVKKLGVAVTPPLAALSVTFSWRAPSKDRWDVIVIIADDLEAVGLPLTSPIWNTDLVQGRWTMPSEEPPDENPSTEEDEPVLPPELQHPFDECECDWAIRRILAGSQDHGSWVSLAD